MIEAKVLFVNLIYGFHSKVIPHLESVAIDLIFTTRDNVYFLVCSAFLTANKIVIIVLYYHSRLLFSSMNSGNQTKV